MAHVDQAVSFNGATTMSRGRRWTVGNELGADCWLQWGHDDGVVEDAIRPRSHQRRARQLQWGHDDGVVEDADWCGCHRPGDSVLQWGHDDGVVEDGESELITADRAGNASMGPRRWSRGRRTSRQRLGRARSRFNGATTMESWKTASLAIRQLDRDPGFNGATTMESWKTARVSTTRARTELAASMGPRRWSRGRRLIG